MTHHCWPALKDWKPFFVCHTWSFLYCNCIFTVIQSQFSCLMLQIHWRWWSIAKVWMKVGLLLVWKTLDQLARASLEYITPPPPHNTHTPYSYMGSLLENRKEVRPCHTHTPSVKPSPRIHIWPKISNCFYLVNAIKDYSWFFQLPDFISSSQKVYSGREGHHDLVSVVFFLNFGYLPLSFHWPL